MNEAQENLDSPEKEEQDSEQLLAAEDKLVEQLALAMITIARRQFYVENCKDINDNLK